MDGFAHSHVQLTHPDRIYWPEDGITKQDLADYYGAVWPLMAPFVSGRPLALLRCPEGIAAGCFFQKHAFAGIDPAISVVADRDGAQLLVIEDIDGLIALVQAGVLEIHPWGAPLADLDRPDMLIFDLDPGEGVAWASVVAGAREIATRLEAAGLAAFVKTSGGKGLHVVAPLAPRAGWEEARRFSHALAEAMAADTPGAYVAVAARAQRKGRIFIDYLRNARGATAVAAYCPRARPGAAVAMPLAWGELDKIEGAAQFTLANARPHLAQVRMDPWRDFRESAKPLPVA